MLKHKACRKCGAVSVSDADICYNCQEPFPTPNDADTSEASELTITEEVSGALRNSIVRVKIVDITMPFGSMVGFMVKWAIASIPAFIILFVLGTFLVAMVGGIFGAAFSK